MSQEQPPPIPQKSLHPDRLSYATPPPPDEMQDWFVMGIRRLVFAIGVGLFFWRRRLRISDHANARRRRRHDRNRHWIDRAGHPVSRWVRAFVCPK